MKIYFEIKEKYKPVYRIYIAYIELYLPVWETTIWYFLHPNFRNKNVKVFDEPLGPLWGHPYRTQYGVMMGNWKRIEAKTLQELREKTEKLIAETIETLRKVKKENEEKMAELKEKEIEVII